MNFTILGAGNMGRAIATLLLKGGNNVTIIDHDDAEAKKLVGELDSVAKAFNATFAGTLLKGQVDGQPLDVFIAGDDAGAKQALANAIQAGGLRPIDVGPLRRARQLEGLGLLHIVLQSTLGTNWASTIKLLS